MIYWKWIVLAQLVTFLIFIRSMCYNEKCKLEDMDNSDFVASMIASFMFPIGWAILICFWLKPIGRFLVKERSFRDET